MPDDELDLITASNEDAEDQLEADAQLAIDQQDNDRNVTLWIVGLLNGFGLAGILGWALSTKHWAFLNVFAAGSLLAGACFASGALLGLLFGVPRGPNKKGSGTKLENTNLVQISDWLTKALVGAGLTQAHRLDDVLFRMGNTYKTELGSYGIAIAIIIYYVIVGFISGWLITRFYVEGMLHRLHKATSDDGVAPKMNTQTKAKFDKRKPKVKPTPEAKP